MLRERWISPKSMLRREKNEKDKRASQSDHDFPKDFDGTLIHLRVFMKLLDQRATQRDSSIAFLNCR